MADPRKKRLDFEQTLKDSRGFNGGLGAISFGIVTGLRQAGASEGEIHAFLAPLKARFPLLDDADCDLLCRVVFERLSEEKAAKGKWY